MQNVQNAAEIQQRVINLVELYRTKVGKESDVAKEAKNFYETAIDYIGIKYSELVGQDYEDWVNHLKINDQLLGHFYSLVAGEKANKAVLEHFLSDYYNSSVFTEEEEHFLQTHFKEMVNYLVQTPSDDLKYVDQVDAKERVLIPNEVLDLIRRRFSITNGSTIYNPSTCFAEFSSIYKGCKFICEPAEVERKEETWPWAWTEIVLYANGIDAEIIEDGSVPESYDAVVTFIPVIPVRYKPFKIVIDKEGHTRDSEVINGYDSVFLSKIHIMYDNLKEGGKMVILTRGKYFFNETEDAPLRPFMDCLISDNALIEVVQLPTKVMMDYYSTDEDGCFIFFIEKGVCCEHTTMIDARFAIRKRDTNYHHDTLDMDAMISMLNNHGLDSITGLRKMVEIPSKILKENLLIPSVYVIEKPLDEELPVPLSILCSIESLPISSIKYDLPTDTPWVSFKNLSELYQGPLDVRKIEKANCPNNPEGWKYGDKVISKFQMGALEDDKPTWDDYRISLYRSRTFVSGNNDIVLYKYTQEHGVQVAVIQASGKPYAVSSGIIVFCPKDDFDANSLAALLRLPIVYRQLIEYQEYGLGNHLNEILVPTNKRIIGDELNRMKREESVTNELGEKFQAMKTEYINEVRMRKHDIRPHLRQLASSERLMLHYIDNVSDMEELKRNLRNQIEHGHVALTSISTIVDHLSDEEQFGTPELLNIDSLLSDIEVNHDESEGFSIEYDCDKESFRKSGFVIPDLSEQWQLAKDQGLDMVNFIQAKSKENLPLFVSIAPVDFQRMVDNIIENARKHGFTDHTRSDYYMGIDMSINSERNMYQIDFSNNGTPLPDGMTKARYGLKGEKAGLTGGTGSGGYIVKTIISHYGGDYDVFCKDGITTIRIYLPIATI